MDNVMDELEDYHRPKGLVKVGDPVAQCMLEVEFVKNILG